MRRATSACRGTSRNGSGTSSARMGERQRAARQAASDQRMAMSPRRGRTGYSRLSASDCTYPYGLMFQYITSSLFLGDKCHLAHLTLFGEPTFLNVVFDRCM